MPTIGDKDFPTTNVDSAVEVAKQIATQFRGNAFDKASLASKLQLAATGGAFNHLVADLRRYGIIEGRGNTMQTTALVQKLAVPQNDQEFRDTVIEMMNRVPLFSMLFEHYHGEVPSVDDLRTTLINLTKEPDRVKVDGVVGKIRTNLASGWSKVGTNLSGGTAVSPSTQKGPPTTSIPNEEGIITISVGKLTLRYPLDEVGIELARSNLNDQFWKVVKAQLKPRASDSTNEGSKH